MTPDHPLTDAQLAEYKTGPLIVDALREGIRHLDIDPVTRALILDNLSAVVRYDLTWPLLREVERQRAGMAALGEFKLPRVTWTKQRGFHYSPDGPWVEWRHVERLKMAFAGHLIQCPQAADALAALRGSVPALTEEQEHDEAAKSLIAGKTEERPGVESHSAEATGRTGRATQEVRPAVARCAQAQDVEAAPSTSKEPTPK